MSFTGKRKKQTSACDECRKGKTKCDGCQPCNRCVKRETTCIFSPQKRRGARKKAKLLEEQTTDIEALPLRNEVIENLLTTFFRYFNTMLLCPLTRADFDSHNLTDPSKKLQYYVALCIASRSSKNRSQTKLFEQTARTIAGEVFDNFTESTALAFAMLTSYYWGQDQGRSYFYFTMTKGICKQIGPKIDPAKLILIEAMATCCIVSVEPYVEELLTRMNAAYDTSVLDVYKRQLRVVMILLEVKYALSRAYPLEEHQKYITVLLEFQRLRQKIPREETCQLLSKLDVVERIMCLDHNKSLFGHVWPLLSSFLTYFRSNLYFINGEYETGITLANQVVENCCKNSSIMIYCPPALVLCNHFSFCVSYLTGNVQMAVKALGILRLISEVLPVAEMALWADSRRLETLINNSNSCTQPGTIIKDRDSVTISPIQISVVEDSLMANYAMDSVRTVSPLYSFVDSSFSKILESDTMIDSFSDLFQSHETQESEEHHQDSMQLLIDFPSEPEKSKAQTDTTTKLFEPSDEVNSTIAQLMENT